MHVVHVVHVVHRHTAPYPNESSMKELMVLALVVIKVLKSLPYY